MSIVTVFIGEALICYASQCHPALLGSETPVGRFELQQRHVIAEGYGGVVIQFKETEKMIYAIHRPYSLDRKIDRKKALKSTNPSFRRSISKGCINVEDAVFEDLLRNNYRVVIIYP